MAALRSETRPTTMTVAELVRLFKRGGIQIPEIQRDVVWEPEDVKNLIDSIFHDYPCGSLIMWEPRIKDEHIIRDLIRPERQKMFPEPPQYFLVDGQQRLTALTAIIIGSDFINNLERESEYNWPTFYFNIDLNLNKTKNIQKAIEASSETGYYAFPWVPIQALFDGNLESSKNFKKLSDEKRKQLSDFRDMISTYSFPVQIIKGFDYPDIGEIFWRVNYLGTQISGAEIHIAKIIPYWKGIAKEFRKYLRELEKDKYILDLTFLMRCLTALGTNQSKIDKFSDQVKSGKLSKNALNRIWKTSRKHVDKLVRILKSSAYLDKTKYFTSKNVLVPLVYYLSKNAGRYIDEKAILRFFFFSQLGNHYSGSTDTVLKKDLQPLSKPKTSIKKALQDLCSDIESETKQEYKGLYVAPHKIMGSPTKNPLILLMYAIMKKSGATDFDLSNKRYLDEIAPDEIHLHHIFPYDFMMKSKEAKAYQLSKGLTASEFRAEVNDIANLTFISKNQNSSIGKESPWQYMPNYTTKDNLKNHFIPTQEKYWRPQKYDKFLKKRRKLLSKAINKFLKSMK